MSEKIINPAREAAFKSLLKMDASKYMNIEVSVTLDRSNLSEKDKGLYTRLVYGVTERLLTLDYIISKYAKNDIKDMMPEAICALRLGIYQLAFMDKIPDHAAVSESVSLCPRKCSGFVNAVLRSFIRDNKVISYPKDILEHLSIEYSVPVPLAKKIVDVYGIETASKIFSSFLEDTPNTLHVNTLKISVDEFLKKYDGNITNVPGCVESNSFDALSEGECFVQDRASALCIEILDPKKDEFIIDTCSAPGGKSFASAIHMENAGEILSFDIHKNKLSLIEKGAKKLGISIIKTAEQDASKPLEEYYRKADRVICDAPCSGFGVIGKKPDVKYKNLADTERLPDIQKKIIRGASEYVKEGGVMVYSTCTIIPEENENICNDFLKENADFELYPFIYNDKETGMLTLLPHIDGTDGFFICRMRRKYNG